MDTRRSGTDRSRRLLELLQQFMPLFHSRLLPAFQPDVREEIGLTKSQVRALMIARRRDPVTATDMGAYMGMTKANMTVLVDELERADLVRRAPDPEDRRKSSIEISNHGIETADRIEAIIRTKLEGLFASLDVDDAVRFEDGLADVVTILEKIGEE